MAFKSSKHANIDTSNSVLCDLFEQATLDRQERWAELDGTVLKRQDLTGPHSRPALVFAEFQCTVQLPD